MEFKPFFYYIDNFDRLTLKEKEEMWEYWQKMGYDWSNLRDLIMGKEIDSEIELPMTCPPSVEWGRKLGNRRVLKKYARLIKELEAKGRFVATEEVAKKLLLWFIINFFFCPAASIYRAYLVQALVKRGIAPNLRQIFPNIDLDEKEIEERENLFPLNWGLLGYPMVGFDEDKILWFEDVRKTFIERDFPECLPEARSIPEEKTYGEIIDFPIYEIEPPKRPAKIKIDENFISYGENTYDYKYRSIVETPCYFNKITGFDIEDELWKRGLPLFSPKKRIMEEIEKVYWDEVKKEISKLIEEKVLSSEKPVEFYTQFYQNYAETSLQIAYDEAFGNLFVFFKNYGDWFPSQATDFVSDTLGMTKSEAKEFIDKIYENLIFDVLELTKIKEEKK